MTTASGPSRAAPASAYKATTGRGGVPQPLQTMGSQAPQQAPTSARTGMSTLPHCIYATGDEKRGGPKLGFAVTWGAGSKLTMFCLFSSRSRSQGVSAFRL